LHEAWLAEVLQGGCGFGGNIVAIGHLLAGKRLVQHEHALAIWQSLFMIVPVASSTFASIAGQFRDLGPNSLGWLFIDEAGQAVPQAAVAWPSDNAPLAKDLRKWCKKRIGTVHTFQGKEESLAWMVLGCDVNTRTPAEWAAGKPNLLNVALTRAKDRFFVDAALWAGLPHQRHSSTNPCRSLLATGAGTCGRCDDSVCYSQSRSFDKYAHWPELRRYLAEHYTLVHQRTNLSAEHYWSRTTLPFEYRIYVRQP
jgi:hypothetical protein